MTGDTSSTRVAVVTGSASGIGFGVAEELAANGWTAIITDVDEAAARAAADRLNAQGGSAVARRMDVTSEADVDSVVPAIAQEFGGNLPVHEQRRDHTHGLVEDSRSRDGGASWT